MDVIFDRRELIGAYLALMIYNLISGDIFNCETIMATMFIALASVISYYGQNFSDQWTQIIKFALHTLYTLLGISIVYDIICVVYNTIFFMGFINTVVIGIGLIMTVTSGLMRIIGDEFYEKASSCQSGRWLIESANLFYNAYLKMGRTVRRTKNRFLRDPEIQSNIATTKDFFLKTGKRLLEINQYLASNVFTEKIIDRVFEHRNNFMSNPKFQPSIYLPNDTPNDTVNLPEKIEDETSSLEPDTETNSSGNRQERISRIRENVNKKQSNRKRRPLRKMPNVQGSLNEQQKKDFMSAFVKTLQSTQPNGPPSFADFMRMMNQTTKTTTTTSTQSPNK